MHSQTSLYTCWILYNSISLSIYHYVTEIKLKLDCHAPIVLKVTLLPCMFLDVAFPWSENYSSWQASRNTERTECGLIYTDFNIFIYRWIILTYLSVGVVKMMQYFSNLFGTISIQTCDRLCYCWTCFILFVSFCLSLKTRIQMYSCRRPKPNKSF